MITTRRALALGLLAGACGSADAHSPIAGVGHFYSGMLHLLLVPAHLMAIVAMGLWLGQRWPANRHAMLGVVLALPVGMVVGVATGWQPGELGLLVLTAAIALAAALARDVPGAVRLVAGVLLGGMVGIDSLPDGASGRALWLSLAGTWLAVLLGLSWVVLLCELASRAWMKIGLRVVASWLAAAAILVLALSWRGPPPGPAAAAMPGAQGKLR